jgi:hypothetical protein
MRTPISRALAYGGGAFLVLFALQFAMWALDPGKWRVTPQAVILASTLGAGLLTLGALVAFILVRRTIATASEAVVLGSATAIPATLLGVYSVMGLGPAGAAGVVALCSCVVALLGGGVLRQGKSHG